MALLRRLRVGASMVKGQLARKGEGGVCGAAASEATSLGCHTDLWDPRAQTYSSLVARMGWTASMPPPAPADAVLGTLRPEVAAATWLPADCEVLCGIHDSNASLLRYLGNDEGTVTTLASGKQIPAETVMYSAGRQGQTDHLDLQNAELEADNRGRIFVDDNFTTKVDHIYAVGDVIGFPALAATSMDQGRLAAYHAFGEPCKGMTELQPIGIYSIPEVSYVGATEVQLTKDAVPYEVGVSRYRELARGQIAGDSYGMLKLLVSTEDLRLLGVHIFGTSATEMVHIGQAVMGCGGTVEYLVDAVFNYPTFSEAYKVAALDVMNKVRALQQFRR